MDPQVQLAQVVARLESVAARLELWEANSGATTAQAQQQTGASGENATSSIEASPALKAFEEQLSGPLQTFTELSSKIGGLVNDQVRSMRSFNRPEFSFVFFTLSFHPFFLGFSRSSGL